MSNSLIIFIKNPELGKVKTRLANALGENKALAVYHRLLNYTHGVSSQVKANRFLYYSSFIDKQDIWSNEVFEKRLQLDGNLGDKMKTAFQEVSEGKKIIIGSDCPEITSEIIENAFEQLDEVDLVIGPANDGGYYLLGMKEDYPSLFEDIQWSTSTVFQDTLTKAKDLGLSIKSLEELVDLDTLKDIEESGFEI